MGTNYRDLLLIEQQLMDIKTVLCQLPVVSQDQYMVSKPVYQTLFDHIAQALATVSACLLSNLNSSGDAAEVRVKQEEDAEEPQQMSKKRSLRSSKQRRCAAEAKRVRKYSDDFDLHGFVDDDDDNSKIDDKIEEDSVELKSEEKIKGKEEEKRENLKELLRWICSLPADKPFLSTFDVLRGHPPEYYGMSGMMRKWPKELTMLLLHCPHFRHKTSSVFFAQLFQQSTSTWKTRLPVFYSFVTGANTHMKKRQKLCNPHTKLLKELFSAGFEQFDPFLNAQETQENCLKFVNFDDDQPAIILMDNVAATPAEANLEVKKDVVVDVNPCVRWLCENPTGIINVTCPRKAFSARDFYHHKNKVIPELQVQHAFALLGICVEEEDVIPKAMVLVHSYSSPCSDANRDFQHLFHTLEASFQVSYQDMFRSTEVINRKLLRGNGQFFRKITTKERKSLEKKTHEQSQQLYEYYCGQAEPYLRRKAHNKVIDLPGQHVQGSDEPGLQLELVEELDYGMINNVAVLMGDDPLNLKVRSLLSEESLLKYINEEKLSTFVGQSQSYHQRQLCRGFTEVFRHFANLELKMICETLPFFHETFFRMREVLSLKQIHKDQFEKEDRQCPNCGKVFLWSKNSNEVIHIAKHLKECNLEHKNCGCQVTFKSPADKRRHMLLKHSGRLYFECPQCAFITRNQMALNNHIDYVHGVPGVEEVCDLCYKTFKCKYHLSIHRFNHESHLCTVCWVEFVGRNSFNNHMKKVHNSGMPCHTCGKMLANKFELEHHIKIAHTAKVWAT